MIDKIVPLAVSKGWNAQRTFDTNEPDNEEADYVVYCQIHRWLQKKHFTFICVMRRWNADNTDYDFKYYVQTWNGINPQISGGIKDYNECFAAAIEAALKLLP